MMTKNISNKTRGDVMDKREYLHSLKNVKIVLGNGFDLHCGLHTKYSDYYCKNFGKYSYIKKQLEIYKTDGHLNFDFSLKKNKNINTWDVFFAINGPDDPRNSTNGWCEIEKMIYSSLITSETSHADIKELVTPSFSIINWNTIKSNLLNNYLGTNHNDRFIVEFIKKRAELINCTYQDFYRFLLVELKTFEKDFGIFVYNQFHNSYLENSNYKTRFFFNNDYLIDAVSTIGELCDENNLTSIDSFNYSSINAQLLKEKFQNINGSCMNPIFGIDTKFSPDDERYVFTKTARRIDSDMVDDTFEGKPFFENVVIYGHSLDDADYSYFFPLFDKLDLTDSTATGVLVFAYSVYDNSKKEQIESDFRKAMSKIIFEYAKSKLISNPERLLDSLSTQKRIFTYLVDEISYFGRAKPELERDWDKIYKNISLICEYREKNL